jgi:NAD+ kinase
MKRIGIIVKPSRPEPLEIVRELVPWLQERRVEVIVEERVSTVARGVTTCSYADMPSCSDMIIVIGGDGTMLGAARLASTYDIPLLGINLGGLGFITEVYQNELFEALDSILNGECPEEKRMMLECTHTRDGKPLGTYTALNDIVINNGPLGTVIDLETSVNDLHVARFKADGLILASPTGSTAYSMSAGGPIVFPTLECITMTPICPHTLTNRPIVLPADVKIDIVLRSKGEGSILTHDGVVADGMKQGDEVVVEKSRHYTRFLIPCGRDHFHVLRTKLKWTER